MNKPHKHCELIKAWADGAEIQFFNYFTSSWKDLNEPIWSDENEYRIKPQTIRYRVALLRYDDGRVMTCNVETEVQEKSLREWHEFVRWLTDWIEVEV